MGKRKNSIFAVDFDGTLCENDWPNIGSPNVTLIRILIAMREKGDKIILWTCRCGDNLTEAIEWCRSHGLEFDAVNDNLPECVAEFGDNSRKIFADVYIDDKSIRPDLKFGDFTRNEQTPL